MRFTEKRKSEMYEKFFNGLAALSLVGYAFITATLPQILFPEEEEPFVAIPLKTNIQMPSPEVPDMSYAFELKEAREQAKAVIADFVSLKERIDSIEVTYYTKTYVGKFYITMYAATVEQCGNDLGITASGKKVTEDPTCWTVAVDPKIIPLGTKLKIDLEGYEDIVFEATDTGSAIKNYDIDVFTSSESLSKQFNPISGVDVWIVE